MANAPLLGVALDGAGSHPAAWRSPGAVDGLFTAERLVRLVGQADAAGVDLAFLDDGFDPPGTGSATLPGRLDALLALARVAPVTRSIGLVPTITTTHTEPFHISKNVATLDLVSGGRAGWHVSVTTSDDAARAFGRTAPLPEAELWAEAEDAVEVVSRLWDSWEDDAVIRDQASGRYIDRAKLHYVDFEGPFFSVRGPSITPRSPQGQPLVVITAGDDHAAAVAARRADIVLIDAADADAAGHRREELRRRIGEAGRDPDAVSVLVDVTIGDDAQRAELDRLGDRSRVRRPAFDLVGDAAEVAATLAAWSAQGAVDGFLVRPDALPATLAWFSDEVVPRLGRTPAPTGGTLRDRLGLVRPANRYVTAEDAR